jgi:hypothetical protein
MEMNTDQTASAKGMHPDIPPEAIQSDALQVFRQRGCRGNSARETQNYQEAFDRLIGLAGQSNKMVTVSWCIAANVAALVGDRDPIGWRWGASAFDDPSIEKAVREFEEFENLFLKRTSELLRMAREMRDCQIFHDEGLADLVKALQPFHRTLPQARAADQRSEWHATAELFTSRIEEHFRNLGLEPQKRGSARSLLVRAVQSLLEMVGQHVETETIRKALT